MKKLLIGLTILASMSVFASEGVITWDLDGEQQYTNCNLDGDCYTSDWVDGNVRIGSKDQIANIKVIVNNNESPEDIKISLSSIIQSLTKESSFLLYRTESSATINLRKYLIDTGYIVQTDEIIIIEATLDIGKGSGSGFRIRLSVESCEAGCGSGTEFTL